jgi:uncharacterized membrane protein
LLLLGSGTVEDRHNSQNWCDIDRGGHCGAAITAEVEVVGAVRIRLRGVPSVHLASHPARHDRRVQHMVAHDGLGSVGVANRPRLSGGAGSPSRIAALPSPETTKELAFNQGFYNLFLAIVSAIGVVAVFLGAKALGVALVFAGVGSIAAAALVLPVSLPDKARAAITQGALPLIAIVLLVIGLAR